MLEKRTAACRGGAFLQTNRNRPVRVLHPVARVVLDRIPKIAVLCSLSMLAHTNISEYKYDTHENLLDANMGFVMRERNIKRRS